VLNNLGIDAYFEGRWDQALDLYARSQRLRERIGDVVGAAGIANNIGEIKSDQGYYEEAEELFTETRDVCARAGNRWLAALAVSNLGRLAARRGRFDEAEELLREALAELEAVNARSFAIEAKARLAEKAVLAGDGEEALRRADETVDGEVAPVVTAMIQRFRAYAFAQLGRLEEAAAALEESLHSAQADAGEEAEAESYELALTLEAAARLAELSGDEDGGALDRSEAIFSRLGVVARQAMPLPTGVSS
jgi:tetratricopeptide (TPR) repeat protein